MKKSPKTSARIFSNSLTKPLAVSVAALLMATPVVHAATYTWNTAVTSGTWDNTSSWVSGTIPTSTDLAYFANTVATSGTLANDAVLGLQFANTAALTLGSGTITIGTSGINHTATGGVTIASAVQLAGSQTWTNVASGTLTVSGSIGASSAGSVVLTNTGAGATTISGVIGNGAGTVSVNQSAGTLTLSGANTFSGGVTLNGGTLLVQGNSTPTSGVVTSGPLGSGTLTLNGGTFGFAGTTAYTIANKVNVVGATNIEVASGQNDVLSGNWSGSGNLTLVPNGSTGQWTFSGDNSGYTGTFTQNSGNTSLTFSNASAGSANAAWVFSNTQNQRTRLNFGTGTISFGSLSGNGSIANIAGSGVATVSVGGLNSSTTFNGVLGGSTAGQGQNINLLIVGGSLTLNSANTYTGTTTVENGSLITGANVAVSTAGAFGNASTAIVLGDANTISSGTAMNPKLLIGGAFTMARNITVGANNNALGNSSTTFTMGGSTANTATFSGTTTLNQNLSVTQVAGGALNLSGNFTSGASGAQTVTLDNVGSVVASGTIGGGTGVIGLTKSNTGTATITGANTYTGATTINNGTLILSGSGAINSSSGITINGSGAKLVQTSSVANTTAITLTQGTLDGTGTVGDVTVGAGTGGILTNGNGSTSALTLSSLNFLGSGTASLRLAGGSTNSPALIVSGLLTTVGTVTLNLTPTTPWNNGTIYNLISYGSYSGSASNFTLGSTTGLSGRQTGTFGVANGFVTLDVEGDTPVWTGLNSQWIQYAQNSSTSGNPSFALKTNHTTTDFWNLDNAEFNDTYNLGSGDVAVTNGAVTIHGGNISATVLSFHNSAVDYTVNSDDGSSIIAGAITKDGSGALTISNANSYNGGTTLNAGTLNINHASAIGTGALTINGGTIDNTSGAAITLINNNAQYWNGDFIFNGTNDLNLGTGAVTLGASPTVTVKRGTLTVAGAISGNYGLTKSGSGTLVLAGANNYNGGTTIGAGVVKIGNATALGANTSSVSVSSGAALDLNGTTMSGQNALTLNGSGISNGGALTNSSATAGTYAGLVSLGSDSSIVASNGGIVLSNAGTITGSGYNLTLDGTANGSSIASIIGIGSGSVTKNGTGTWALTGANTYSGGTILNNGTISIGNNSALGTGAVTLNGGTLMAGASGATIANNLAVNGATTFDALNNLYLNGKISGSGAITRGASSNNSVYLGGDNSGYTGTFTSLSSAQGSNAAVVRFTSANAGSAGAKWIFNNTSIGKTTLDFATGTISFGSLTGAGQIQANASGGTEGISVGALGLNDLFTGSIANGNGTVSLTKMGSGTMTLGGVNTYTGATTVNAGELDVNGSLAAGSTVGVSSGAFLGGSGTVGGIVNLNGGTLGGNGLKVVGQINATGNSNVNGNVNATGGVNVSSGATLGGSGNITGSVGVTNATINGSGLAMSSATFDGNSRLTGTTTISGGVNANSGTLSINGGSITGAVTVMSGATLTGAGAVTDITVGAGATLSPGTASDSAAVTMISNGNVSFTDETSTFAIRLGVVSATDNDVLSVSGGTVDLGGATLSLSLGGAFYTALTNGQLDAGHRWTILLNSDESNGSLSGSFAQGFEITGTGAGGDYKFVIGYGQMNGTDSNVYVELEAVPEPSTWAMIVGGMGMLAFGRRFRRVMEE